MFKQGGRSYFWCWHRWYIGGSVDLCQQRACRLAPFSQCSQAPLVPLWQGLQCWERGGHTLRRNTARSGLTIRTSALKTWVPTLLPIGLRRPLRIEEVCASHLASVLLPPILSHGDRWWHTLRKDVTCGPSNPAPPLGTTQTVQSCYPTRTPLQDHNR